MIISSIDPRYHCSFWISYYSTRISYWPQFFFCPQKVEKNHPQKLLRKTQIHFFPLTASTAQMAQTEEFIQVHSRIFLPVFSLIRFWILLRNDYFGTKPSKCATILYHFSLTNMYRQWRRVMYQAQLPITYLALLFSLSICLVCHLLSLSPSFLFS